jgi:hypothetical protein
MPRAGGLFETIDVDDEDEDDETPDEPQTVEDWDRWFQQMYGHDHAAWLFSQSQCLNVSFQKGLI